MHFREVNVIEGVAVDSVIILVVIHLVPPLVVEATTIHAVATMFVTLFKMANVIEVMHVDLAT